MIPYTRHHSWIQRLKLRKHWVPISCCHVCLIGNWCRNPRHHPKVWMIVKLHHHSLLLEIRLGLQLNYWIQASRNFWEIIRICNWHSSPQRWIILCPRMQLRIELERIGSRLAQYCSTLRTSRGYICRWFCFDGKFRFGLFNYICLSGKGLAALFYFFRHTFYLILIYFLNLRIFFTLFLYHLLVIIGSSSRLYLVILLKHPHDVDYIRIEWANDLSLLDLIIDHQLPRIPLCDQSKLLIGDQLLHVDVTRLTKGTVELTFNKIVLKTFLTG